MKKKVIKGWVPNGETETETMMEATSFGMLYRTQRECKSEYPEEHEDGDKPAYCTVTITVEHKEKK